MKLMKAVLVLIFLQILICQEQDEWKQFPNRLLFPVFFEGSSAMQSLDVAVALSQQGYNITVLCPYDMQIKHEGPSLRKYPFYISQYEISPQNYREATINYTIKGFQLTDVNRMLARYFFVENTTIIDDLKNHYFSVGVGNLFGIETLIINYLNLTSIRLFSNLPELLVSSQMKYPVNSALVPPQVGPSKMYKNFQISSIVQRFANEVQKYLLNLIFITDLFKEEIPEEALYAADKFGKGIFVGGGHHGFVDSIPRSPNIIDIYPFSYFNSKNQQLEQIPEDISKFMDKFDKVVLISFGTRFMPLNETQLKMIEIIKKTEKIGYIWTLKEYGTQFKEIQQMNIPNLLLKAFVPQKSLLNHDKIKLFITHCGGNAAIETQYYGKAILGFPQDVDQSRSCLILENLQLGYFLENDDPNEQIIDKINNLLFDESNPILKKVEQVRKFYEFEERYTRNITYYVNLGSIFSFNHLILQDGHGLGEWVLLYDIDIVCYLTGAIIFVLYILKGLLCGRRRKR